MRNYDLYILRPSSAVDVRGQKQCLVVGLNQQMPGGGMADATVLISLGPCGRREFLLHDLHVDMPGAGRALAKLNEQLEAAIQTRLE